MSVFQFWFRVVADTWSFDHIEVQGPDESPTLQFEGEDRALISERVLDLTEDDTATGSQRQNRCDSRPLSS